MKRAYNAQSVDATTLVGVSMTVAAVTRAQVESSTRALVPVITLLHVYTNTQYH